MWAVRSSAYTILLLLSLWLHLWVLTGAPRIDMIFETYAINGRSEVPIIVACMVWWERFLQTYFLWLPPLFAAPLIALWRSRGTRFWCLFVSSLAVLLVFVSVLTIFSYVLTVTIFLAPIGERA